MLIAYFILRQSTEDEIKKAISEIYSPSPNFQSLPSSIYGCILSISHKIDTLTGDFIIDIIPSSGNDPYGLRRAANGIFRIIYEKDLDI